MWYSVMGNLVYTEDSGGFVLVLLYGIIRYNILFLTYSLLAHRKLTREGATTVVSRVGRHRGKGVSASGVVATCISPLI
jgi:hypothetical protein